MLCIASSVNAQIPYGVYEVPFQPLSLPQAQALSLGDDYTSGAIPIGFSFSFFGIPYTQLAITSNAYLESVYIVLPNYFDQSTAEITASSHTSFLVNLGDGTLRFVYNNTA